MVERLMAEGNDEHFVKAGQNTTGWIEVIAGSMFSGKSEELIRRLRRAKIARLKVQVFKPEIDVRYSRDHIVSHSEMRHESRVARTAAEILAQRGLRVITAGLDQDYTGRPFEPMPQLLAVAEYITKTHAICVRCGQPANYSQRIVEVEGQVVVGAADAYEARCRRCFVPHADAPTRHITEAAD